MVSATMQREQKVPGMDTMVEGNRRKATEGHALKKVFICSPFHPVGETAEQRDRDLKRNIALAEQACRYAVNKGYVPYAPHLYFPCFLSESDPDEREMGILMGLSWLARCDELWFTGVRISKGMSREITQAREWGIPVKGYIPIPGDHNRVFDVHFQTEEEFYKALYGEM